MQLVHLPISNCCGHWSGSLTVFSLRSTYWWETGLQSHIPFSGPHPCHLLMVIVFLVLSMVFLLLLHQLRQTVRKWIWAAGVHLMFFVTPSTPSSIQVFLILEFWLFQYVKQVRPFVQGACCAKSPYVMGENKNTFLRFKVVFWSAWLAKKKKCYIFQRYFKWNNQN